MNYWKRMQGGWTLSFLKKYVRKYGGMFCVAVLFLTFEALCDLLQPTIMARIVDEGVAIKDIGVVLRLGGLMLLITAFGAVSASVRNIVSSRVSGRFGADLRSDLFKSIQRLSFEHIDKFERASLVTRLTNDVTQVQNFTNGLMRIFVKAPLLCIGSLIMAARLNPRLAVVLAVVVPIVGVLIALNMKVGFPLFLKVQRALDRLNSVMREYLSGVRVVKAFNRFDYETAKFERTNEEYRTRAVTAMRAMSIFNPGIMLTVNAGIIAVIWFGSLRVQAGQMQVGHIIAFINYMTQILFSLMLISMVFNMFVRARASAGRIGEVFAQRNAMTWKEGAAPADPLSHGRIDFEGVSFTYEGASGEPALRNVTFTCLPGQTVGIIGSTGSGKSTLVSLIPRFYDASEGSIRVGGKDVRDIDPKLLRETIALVPQKTVLFSGTIAENLRWGKEDAGPEELEWALRMSEAYEFVAALPEGMETKLGQKGVNLSGGQKQRLSIARALVRKPDILILDDSTSAVDAATEARIKESLKSYARNLTCLIIAQRITSVMDADRIIVMDNGEIVGDGLHDELMKNCRVYREIYLSQVGKEMQGHAAAGRTTEGA